MTAARLPSAVHHAGHISMLTSALYQFCTHGDVIYFGRRIEVAHPQKKDNARLDKAVTVAERGTPGLFTRLLPCWPHAPIMFAHSVAGAGQRHTGQLHKGRA